MTQETKETEEEVSLVSSNAQPIFIINLLSTQYLHVKPHIFFKFCPIAGTISYLIKADHCDWSVGSILGSGTLAAGQSHTSVLTVHISVQCNYRIHTPQLTQTKSEFK